MFIEGVAAIIVVAPLVFSAALALGIDPVHLGIIMIANLAIGMYTPPFGLNIFVTQTHYKYKYETDATRIIDIFRVQLYSHY